MKNVAAAGSGHLAPIAGALIAALAAMLIFVRLDHRLLWVDEAETALLARSILTYGVPKAFDGKTLVSQEAGVEFGPDYVWLWTPWLEKYLTAASFALLGESTLTARLPFALAGWLAVLSVYLLALALFRDRWTGVLAMAFLTCSVPFLLQVRQCRYYALVILASIWVVVCLVGLLRGRRGAVAGVVVAMTALFHSNTLTFLATAVALVPCALVMGVSRAAFRRGLLAAGVIVLLNTPWAIYFNVLGKTAEEADSFAKNLHTYAFLTDRYTVPVAALAAFVFLVWILRRTHPLLDARASRPFLGVLTFVAVYIVTLAAAPWSHYRWSANLLPLAAVLMACMCRGMLRWNRAAGTVFAGCLLFTGLFHHASAWAIPPIKFKYAADGRSFPTYDLLFPLGNYLHEVTHPFAGPMEGLLRILADDARPGDRIFITYGDLVLKFYTDHEVRGGQSGQDLSGWQPDWVVIRSFIRFGHRRVLKADYERMLAWLDAEVPRQNYTEVAAPGPDGPWDNSAEPQFHWFRVPEEGERMQVYRLAAGGSGARADAPE